MRYPDASFDVAFADNVMEHLAEPSDALREVHRVLKPGGVFLFKTPNRTHYMPAVARATPHSFHRFVNERRGRATADTFPTLYRANTPRDVRDLTARCGFALERLKPGRGAARVPADDLCTNELQDLIPRRHPQRLERILDP